MYLALRYAQQGTLGNAGSMKEWMNGSVWRRPIANRQLESSRTRCAVFTARQTTGADGEAFKFTNREFQFLITLVVAAEGLRESIIRRTVDVRSAYPVTLQIGLKIGTAAQTVTVEAIGPR